MNEVLSVSQRLRLDFDQAYAQPQAPRAQDGEGLLAIALGGEPYAIRVAEIARLAAGRPLAPLPSAAASFMGLAGLRGELLPAWDLGALLGYAPLRGQPRWLASSATAPRWAAAFERFDGYLTASAADLSPYAGEGRAQGFATQLCSKDGLLRPVISFERILQVIQKGGQG